MNMEKSLRYLIIGAGPAGLSMANLLLQHGIEDFLVIEKESEAGGLCRSADVDGSPFDIGGGHFLDVRRPSVDKFLFEFMPLEEWDRYTRNSKIAINGTMIGSPIEANIWQMKESDQVEYIKSVVLAGCNQGLPKPEKFIDWITWKLGRRIAEDYMIPYNQKMFGEDLNELGTYWLDKLPDVSTDETIISCLQKKAYGKQPGHAEFYYPKKYGYGELWRRMADRLGDRIIYNTAADSLDTGRRMVNSEYSADYIINTAPWTSFKHITDIPDTVRKCIGKLKHSSTVMEYHPEKLDSDAHWIYYPDPKLSYHRILVRSNFCPNSKGYWTETNADRFHRNDGIFFENDYTYPLNTIEKQSAISEILKYFAAKSIIGLGRWGEWQHYNSDAVVEKAMNLYDSLSQKGI